MAVWICYKLVRISNECVRDQLSNAHYLYFSKCLVPPLTKDNGMMLFIEFTTTGQRLCPIWHDLHKGRITSFNFVQVLKTGRNTNSLSKDIKPQQVS